MIENAKKGNVEYKNGIVFNDAMGVTNWYVELI
jgi:hypothetical protein